MINLLLARQDLKTRVLESVDLNVPSNSEWIDLNEKTLICMYSPLFNLITNGSKVGGQMELVKGIPTGKMIEISDLNLIRANGFPRQIPLLPFYIKDKLFGYIPQVTELCVAGFYKLHLSEEEQLFYGQFVITERDPTFDYITTFF